MSLNQLREILSSNEKKKFDKIQASLTPEIKNIIDKKLQELSSLERSKIFEDYINSTKDTSNYISYLKNERIQKAIKQNSGTSTIYDIHSISDLLMCLNTIVNSNNDPGTNYSSSIKNYLIAIIKHVLNLSNLKNQTIYYGSPGCGKSYKVKNLIDIISEDNKFRTTFHPDSDYYNFVGSYKPTLDINNNIVYKFIPQVFTRAYIKAWENMQNAIETKSEYIEPVVLVIEEINRGNCAQIFGDLFQLLDRDKDGYSEYPIDADEDLKLYLKDALGQKYDGIKDGKLKLPPNLYIIATMNTSDQSLFPMDSAFKRRWAWKYVPIDYNHTETANYNIIINGSSHPWNKFLEEINKKIYEISNSEDKMLGNFFIKGNVDEEEFVEKVMFYLWNDILKLEYATEKNYFFRKEDDSKFTFSELADSKNRSAILESFMKYLKV